MAISDLRLQVILQAIDRATAPLQRINSGSTATAKALRDTRERLKELGTQQKAIGEFRELRTGLDATAAKLDNAKEKASRLARELGQAGPPTKALTQQLAAARQVARDLGEQHQRQAAQVRRCATACRLPASAPVSWLSTSNGCAPTSRRPRRASRRRPPRCAPRRPSSAAVRQRPRPWPGLSSCRPEPRAPAWPWAPLAPPSAPQWPLLCATSPASRTTCWVWPARSRAPATTPAS